MHFNYEKMPPSLRHAGCFCLKGETSSQSELARSTEPCRSRMVAKRTEPHRGDKNSVVGEVDAKGVHITHGKAIEYI